MSLRPDETESRERLSVHGQVQGVGFRPFVYRLAQTLQLCGWVRNDAQGVSIEVQGKAANLAQFRQRLVTEKPPTAQIDKLEYLSLAPQTGRGEFRVLETPQEVSDYFDAKIGADLSVCESCVKEMFDPQDRRYRYPFINCTDCGPRYSIAQRLPYARAATSMSTFNLCPDCLAEYTTPASRRFHAEPNACPHCGPQLRLWDAQGLPLGDDPLAETLSLLRAGAIVAIKGLGGFHLACDARNRHAVARLRARKAREEKPLAIMLANTRSVTEFAQLGTEERLLLESSERPIVLLPKSAHCDERLPGIAPGIAWLGVMLPYTPMHYLLFHQAAGCPPGIAWLEQAQPLALVMTSANPRGEPLVTANQEALERLSGIADAWLVHDRDIVARCDDSVMRVTTPGQPQFLRRARGYTPRAISLARNGPDVLALGGLFKNALCVTRREQAFLSPHIGDLDNAATCLALEETAERMLSLLEVRPQRLAHDKHPDFFSTRLAERLAAQWQVPALAVQHHHAHIAAVLAEHRVEEPVLGLALDGVGLGEDSTAWGGELLRVDGADCRRLGHLQALRLPGGDRAAREPWRMGAAALHLLGRDEDIAQRFAAEPPAAMLGQILAQELRSPPTTSLGRYFDAAAGLLGVKSHMSYEGQAAMLLEGLAAEQTLPPQNLATLFQMVEKDGQWQLDLRPLLTRLCETSDAAQGAALFHAVLTAALVEWVALAAAREGLKTVACGGGCFLNAVLVRGLRQGFARRGLRMLEAAQVPPGDGGLALGQAWVVQRMSNVSA